MKSDMIQKMQGTVWFDCPHRAEKRRGILVCTWPAGATGHVRWKNFQTAIRRAI